ncbi:Disulfide bond formation protein [Sphingomonas antarctica]|uniref:disulfide bond formation protein B n=1 Tax=Sphingomonas antarctica TaxID=2040274 RepID=UPI0039EB645D
MTPLARANALALAAPAIAMAGALGSQYIGHLYPCEMCHWQRWPHEIAIALAILAFFLPRDPRRSLIGLAAVAILISGAIGIFHAGVEYHWWEGFTTCSRTGGAVTLDSIMATPMIRCDSAQWTFHGVSLAGFNALWSILGGIGVFALLKRAR